MMQPRASMFGGSWHNDGDAGSRYANVATNWPENSNDNLGARGRSDQRYWRAHANNRGRDHRVRLLAEGQMPVAAARSQPNRCSALITVMPAGLRALAQQRQGRDRYFGLRPKTGGQPICPASANTLHGPAERGVGSICSSRPAAGTFSETS
jgi:hypothetical protein